MILFKKVCFSRIIPGNAVDPGLSDAGNAPAHAVDDALGAPSRIREPIPEKSKQIMIENVNKKVNTNIKLNN